MANRKHRAKYYFLDLNWPQKCRVTASQFYQYLQYPVWAKIDLKAKEAKIKPSYEAIREGKRLVFRSALKQTVYPWIVLNCRILANHAIFNLKAKQGGSERQYEITIDEV